MEKLSKLIILYFETQEVLIYNYDQNIWENPEEFMNNEEININSSNCQWMVVEELNIKIL